MVEISDDVEMGTLSQVLVRDGLTLKELSFEHPDGVINVSAGCHK